MLSSWVIDEAVQRTCRGWERRSDYQCPYSEDAIQNGQSTARTPVFAGCLLPWFERFDPTKRLNRFKDGSAGLGSVIARIEEEMAILDR